jgi:hypothetical protein
MREVARRAGAAVGAAPIKRVHPGSTAHRAAARQQAEFAG